MICEKCKQNNATVHTVEVVNGVKTEHFYCAACAGSASMHLPTLMEMFSGFQGVQKEAAPVCACGHSFLDFQKTGLLGCADCYNTYRAQLLPVIKRVQGGRMHHVGRRPAGSVQTPELAVEQPAAAVQEADECTRLREELQLAVKEERYERAAELRDRLKALEGGAS